MTRLSIVPTAIRTAARAPYFGGHYFCGGQYYGFRYAG
jgi:hypothetical protein